MAVDPDDLLDSIAQRATKPASVTSDAGGMSTHGLRDQLRVVEMLKQQQAVTNGPFGGMRIGRWVPPGSVGKLGS